MIRSKIKCGNCGRLMKYKTKLEGGYRVFTVEICKCAHKKGRVTDGEYELRDDRGCPPGISSDNPYYW